MVSAASPSYSNPDLAYACIGLAFSWTIAVFVFDRWLAIRPSLKTLDAYVESIISRSAEHDPSLTHVAQCHLCRLHQRVHGWGRSLKAIMTDDVLGAWRQAHAMDAEMARNLGTIEAVKSRLRVESPLLRANQADNKVLYKAIGRQLKAQPPSLGELRSSLADCLVINFNARDTKFESLANLQTKSAWMALGGMGLIVGLGVGFGRYELLLFGAVGGLLSRLARLLTGVVTSNDYGVSGSSLVLAPVSGALAGFGGVLLLQALSGLGVLSTNFTSIWSKLTPLSFAMAVVLGFSERIFGNLITQTESAITGK